MSNQSQAGICEEEKNLSFVLLCFEGRGMIQNNQQLWPRSTDVSGVLVVDGEFLGTCEELGGCFHS
jgi:hypothetical protein